MSRFNFRNTVGFVFKNFAAPIAFLVTFYGVGEKPAIAVAVIIALIQLLFHLIFRWPITAFFGLATFFTLIFGGTDLLIASPRYFRLEGFAQNLCIGVLFLYTLKTHRSMIWRLAMAIPEEYRPALHREDERYLARLTLVWALYFILKAVAFLILAFEVDLGKLYVIRTTIGTGSAVLLFLGEILYRKKFRRKLTDP